MLDRMNVCEVEVSSGGSRLVEADVVLRVLFSGAWAGNTLCGEVE